MLRGFKSLPVLGLMFLVASCSSFESQRGRAKYESYVWSELQEGSIVSEGSSLVNVRWLEMDDKYFAKRFEVLGFEDVLTAEHHKGPKNFLMVAVHMKPGALFSKGDFKVFWNAQELGIYREIVSVLELRSLYPFAYPFHRVFLYEIPQLPSGQSKQSGAKFSIWTPWGKLDQEQS